jgi:transcriptional regulator with XRE-family HTH domain
MIEPLDNSHAFGHAVLRARKARGLKPEDVALATGIGTRVLAEIERGKRTVQLDQALRVAQAVGLRISADDAG